jgi:hypothetical protein
MAEIVFGTPYIMKTPVDDTDEYGEPGYADSVFVFDPPEGLGYDPIEPGVVRWSLDGYLVHLLANWAAAKLGFTRTKAGNFRRKDKEHLDQCFGRLERRIYCDLLAWLENAPRYQGSIRDRVNETVHELLNVERRSN